MFRLPPYGRDVACNATNVFVYAGAVAWKAGQARAHLVGKNSVLVLPPGEDYRQYRWPVQRLQLMLIWPDGALYEVRQFAEYLVQCGASLVVAPHDADQDECLFARPERATA